MELPLGSLTTAVDCPAVEHRQLLERIFRNRLQEPQGTPSLRLSIRAGGVPPHADDRLEWHGLELRSDFVSAALHAEDPPHIDLRIRSAGPELEHYVRVVLNSMLRRLGAIRLHASACCYRGRTYMMLGPRGSGKSTLCVCLGLDGGVVLSEDQILLQTSPLRISGCDGRLRVTEQTERYFFPQPLDAPLTDFNGALKKEVPLDGLLPHRAFADYKVDELFFPRVGQQLRRMPLSKRAVVLRLLDDLLPTHRFATPAERDEFLDVLTNFANSVSAYDLELTPRLEELSLLRAWLG